MRISKETSSKSLKYFGDIIHCKTKGEVRDVRNKINGREKELAQDETSKRHALCDMLAKAYEELHEFSLENKEFDAVEDEYLF